MAKRDESPMEIGMRMAKKMMAQMDQGASPMEMMQTMMPRMRPGDDTQPMEKMMGMCMGMCAEILDAIKQTNALAVHATPELQQAFGEWLKTTEDKVMNLIAKGVVDSAELAGSLDLSERSVHYIVTRLADRGGIRLSAKPAN